MDEWDSEIFDDPVSTRLSQEDPKVVAANHAWMTKFGAYNLVKVKNLDENPPVSTLVGGFITLLSHVSGLTPEQMTKMLGLSDKAALKSGAAIYQLSRVPAIGEFKVRGYTTLPGGLRLKEGVDKDPGGFPAGQGAWQAVLTEAIPATLFDQVGVGKVFKPPMHPNTRKLYGLA